jgi:hypothetical protein
MARLLSKKLPKHFWNEEKGLTSIFILLCISNFIVLPFFDQQQVIHIIMRIIWFALLITGISTLSESRSQIRNLSVLPVLLVIISILDNILDYRILAYIDFLIELSVYFLLTGMVLVKVFEDGSVTIHRVIGSIVGYMLIGNIWALTYQFIYIQLPGSLQFPDSAGPGIAPSIFLYFSYTTLTTTGFGEILPVQPITRTLVIIEQLIGVLYPVVLIGRLVSLVTGSKDVTEKGN